jgi:hypothetical protein
LNNENDGKSKVRRRQDRKSVGADSLATTVMAAKLGISLSVRDEELANFRNNLADVDSLLNVRFAPPGAVARGSF